MFEIRHDKRGYYTLFVDGVFQGNFDTVSEAVYEYENIVAVEDKVKELVSA